jgi:hypothetical protein
VYRPINIDLYRYCSNNPIVYLDPDGLVDLNLFSKTKDAFLYKAAETEPSPKNTFTVGAHGSPTRVDDQKGNPITPRKLAEIIRNHPKYKPGMTVRLLSCNTGVSPGDGKVSYAQQLADALSAKVEAPNNLLWYFSNGATLVAPRKWSNPKKPNYNKLGVLYYFEPRKKK